MLGYLDTFFPLFGFAIWDGLFDEMNSSWPNTFILYLTCGFLLFALLFYSTSTFFFFFFFMPFWAFFSFSLCIWGYSSDFLLVLGGGLFHTAFHLYFLFFFSSLSILYVSLFPVDKSRSIERSYMIFGRPMGCRHPVTSAPSSNKTKLHKQSK